MDGMNVVVYRVLVVGYCSVVDGRFVSDGWDLVVDHDTDGTVSSVDDGVVDGGWCFGSFWDSSDAV